MKTVVRTAEAAVIYFAILFAILVLGQLVHEPLVLFGVPPLIAQIAAVSLEALLLLSASGYVLRGMAIPPSMLLRACVGFGAVALLLAVSTVELMFLVRYWKHPIALTGGASPLITGGLLLLAAVLPMIRQRRV